VDSNPLVRDEQLALTPTRGDGDLVNPECRRWTLSRDQEAIDVCRHPGWGEACAASGDAAVRTSRGRLAVGESVGDVVSQGADLHPSMVSAQEPLGCLRPVVWPSRVVATPTAAAA